MGVLFCFAWRRHCAVIFVDTRTTLRSCTVVNWIGVALDYVKW